VKSGIYGKALASSLKELPLILSNMELLTNIKVVGGLKLARLMEMLEALPYKINHEDKHLGKLVDFSDKEGKTRIVAILDYWSQTALFNIHKVLFNILRKIEADCTFNQGKFKTILTNLPGPFYSYDLTAATDRMPIALQMRVLEHVIGSVKAIAWVKLLSDRPYMTSIGKSIFYKIGQPMGGYSSWPAMALTHHAIVQIAAYRSKIRFGLNPNSYFSDYTLLGDDIVIGDTLVALEYLELLQALDMPISLPKSLESIDSFEFAKRLFVNKIEVTGFSLGGLESVKGSYSSLKNFLITQSEHGWTIPFDHELQFVFYLLKFNRSHNIMRLIQFYKVFHFVMLSLKKPLSDTMFWEDFLRNLLEPGATLFLPTGLTPSQFLLTEIGRVRLAKMERDTRKIHSGLIDTLEQDITQFRMNFSTKLLVGAITSGLPGRLTVLNIVRTSIKEVSDFSDKFHTGLTKSLGHSIVPDFFNKKEVPGEAALVKPLIMSINNVVKLSIGFNKFGRIDLLQDYSKNLSIIKTNLKKALIV
jgi:hypothetical protein